MDLEKMIKLSGGLPKTPLTTRAVSYDRPLTRITKLDVHLAHACNLSCEQCTHFSNYRLGSIVDKDDIVRDFRVWHRRLVPHTIALLGGEPLLNKKILSILVKTRYYWPDTILELWTNGLLLDQYPDLPHVLAENRIIMHVSDHSIGSNDLQYQHKFARTMEIIEQWVRKKNITITVRDFRMGKIHIYESSGRETRVLPIQPKFRFYQGYGPDMLPYDHGDPESSWQNCPVYHDCFQLLDGRIYKCAPLAYLPLLDKKFGLDPKWDPYLTYRPLEPTASDDEIREFFQRGAESVCSMCPSQRIPMYSDHDPMKFIPIKLTRSRDNTGSTA